MLSQRFQIGTGYDSSLFEIVTDDGAGLPTTLLGSVRYNGPVPNNAVPASCNCKYVPPSPGTDESSSSLSSSTSEQSSSSATSVSASETSDTSSTQESSSSSEVSSTQEPSSSTQNHLHQVRHLLLKSRHLLKVRHHLLIPQLKLLLVNHQLHHHHLLRPLLLPSLQLRNHHHLLRDLHLHKNHPQVKNHLLKNHHLLPKNHLLPKVHLPLKSHHLLKVHRHLLILQQILPQLLQQMNKAVLVLVNHPLKTNQLTLLSLILPVQPILVLLQTSLTPIPIVNPQTLLLQQIPALLIVILLQVPKLTQM